MLATLASAMTLPFLGKIVDRYSIAGVGGATILMLALACMVLALSQSIFLLVLALFGLRLFGQGMMTHVALVAMGRWFVANRGKAVSISTLGFNLGQAVFPVAFIGLIGVVSWQQGWLIAAAVLAFVALPAVVFSLKKERSPHSIAFEGVEKTYGLRQWTRNEMLRDPVFWLTCIGVLAGPFISTAIFFHQDFVLAERGWSYQLFALGFVVLTVVSIISGLISGIVIDRKSATALLPATLLPLALGCIVLGLGTSQSAMIAYMFLLGVSSGIAGSVLGSIWPEVYGTEHLGAIRSVVMALMVLFSALGPGVMGWMIDFGIGLDTQFLGFGIYCIFAAGAMMIAARKFKARQRLAQV